jgi:hypothetical protein
MKCPGQDSRYWQFDAIFETTCPKCGAEMEFFKDDAFRVCRSCGHRMPNPAMDFGCAAYCPYAEQCLGSVPPGLKGQKEALLKDRVAQEVKRRLGHDFKGIGHAMRTARYAERIGKAQGAELPVVLAAAYLCQLEEKESEKSAPGETGGPAREVLLKLDADQALIHAVCDLINRVLVTDGQGGPDFETLHDARMLAGLDAQHMAQQSAKPLSEPAARLLTAAGREISEELMKTGKCR